MEWKQIKPDFSSSSNSMQNAMSGLSSAGTVFEKMREGILAEEQRAIENARAADAAALAQATLDEEIRANQALEDYRAGQLANEQERLKQQGKLYASQIAQNQAAASEIMARINQANTNKKAWQLAVQTVDTLSPKYQEYDSLLKAQAVTQEAFDQDKATNKDKSIYKDYADYASFQAANDTKIKDFDKWLNDNGINKAAFTGLGTAHGRVDMLEKAYVANGGFGSIRDLLSIADSNGLVYETTKMQQEAATKAEWAKTEKSLATPNGIATYLEPYAMQDDARNALNQLALTLITKKGNSTLSNQDILNDLITRTVLPGMDVNAIKRAYNYFTGNSGISFRTKEDLDAALEAAGLKASSGAASSGAGTGTGSGNGGSTGLQPVEAIRKEVMKENPNLSFNEGEAVARQIAQQRLAEVNQKVTDRLNPALMRDKLAEQIPSTELEKFGIKDIASANYDQLFPVIYKLGLDINDFTNNEDLRNAYVAYRLSRSRLFR